MAQPPPIPPRPPGYELLSQPSPTVPPRRTSHEGVVRTPPPPPPRPQPQQQPSGWSHLVYEDGSPTPLFTSLMTDFFNVLDPEHTGYLTPEAFSSFLEANGFSSAEDPYPAKTSEEDLSRSPQGRLNQKPLFGPWLPIDNADFELKAAYEAWFFPHRVVPRSSVRPLLPHGGMPLLALPGLIDYLAIECSGEGPARVRGLNAALTRYGPRMDPKWLAMGEIPDWTLPREMPGKVRRRIDEANARSARTARERIEATRVQHEIMAQGRRNAEELTSDVRYVWRPY